MPTGITVRAIERFGHYVHSAESLCYEKSLGTL